MRRIFGVTGVVLAMAVAFATSAHAQSTALNFGGLRADTSLPVEVTAEQLAVNQSDGTAIFSGEVRVVQGEMRLSADEITVEYGTGDQRKIARMLARGNVVIVSGPDAAEADTAEYTIDSGAVTLIGNVALKQGVNILTGEKLTLDLTAGTGIMEGRVKTILQPGKP